MVLHRAGLSASARLSGFLIRHSISELPRPIAVKLWHMINICVNFITQVQKFGGPPLKLIE